jgi:AcrR family transcriptional regulator
MIKKERITEAALQLFAERSYKNVRMDDLAEYLGISKKTLYNHFDSKESLLTAALQKRVDASLSILEEICDDTSLAFIPRLKEVLRSASSALSFTDVFSSDSGLPNDLVEAVFPRLHDHILALVKKLVDEGRTKGYIRADIPVETLPYILLGIIETFLKMESRYGVKASLKDMLIFLQSIVFTGLLTEKGRIAEEGFQ